MFTLNRKSKAAVLVSLVMGMCSAVQAGEPALAYSHDDERLEWGACPAFLGEGWMILVSGKMTVTYDNQKSEMIETGMYAFGPSKHPHKAYCEAGDPCVLFIAFEDPIDAFEVMKPVK
ncbi:MAG: cupin [Campylobacterales bacterium]